MALLIQIAQLRSDQEPKDFRIAGMADNQDVLVLRWVTTGRKALDVEDGAWREIDPISRHRVAAGPLIPVPALQDPLRLRPRGALQRTERSQSGTCPQTRATAPLRGSPSRERMPTTARIS